MFMYNMKRKLFHYQFPSIINDFIQFRDYQAMQAYKGLNSRYYAGRMVQLQFVNIPSWSAAICGTFDLAFLFN